MLGQDPESRHGGAVGAGVDDADAELRAQLAKEFSPRQPSADCGLSCLALHAGNHKKQKTAKKRVEALRRRLGRAFFSEHEEAVASAANAHAT